MFRASLLVIIRRIVSVGGLGLEIHPDPANSQST
jgi:hypothetical protein